VPHGLAGLLLDIERLKETEMLGQGTSINNFSSCSRPCPKPWWRNIIDTQQVGPQFADLLKITAGLIGGNKTVSV